MSEWKEFKLGKCTKKIGSGATPRGGANNYKESGISIIRSQNVLDLKFSNNGLAYIDEEQASKLNNVTVQEDDILLNITGDSVARVCKVPNKILPARVNQHVAIIRANNNISSDFLLYYLQSIREYLLTLSEIGGTRRALTKGMIENLDINLPPLPEQKAIASVLSSLDDKIDLLHRQNQTLETMAETLFRQWFVEEAEEDWEDGVLGDIMEFNYGKSLPQRKRKQGQYPVYGSQGIVDYHSDYLVKGPGIITGRKGTLGIVNYTFKDFFPIDTTFYISSKLDSANLLFEYFFLRNINLKDMNTDSAVPGLNRNLAYSLQIKIPPKNLVDNFNELVEPFYRKIKTNQNHIKTVTNIRDTLLPKLMNGKVRVKS